MPTNLSTGCGASKSSSLLCAPTGHSIGRQARGNETSKTGEKCLSLLLSFPLRSSSHWSHRSPSHSPFSSKSGQFIALRADWPTLLGGRHGEMRPARPVRSAFIYYCRSHQEVVLTGLIGLLPTPPFPVRVAGRSVAITILLERYQPPRHPHHFYSSLERRDVIAADVPPVRDLIDSGVARYLQVPAH